MYVCLMISLRNILNQLSIKNAQLYLYANNLNIILWKAYKGELDADYTVSTGMAGPDAESVDNGCDSWNIK